MKSVSNYLFGICILLVLSPVWAKAQVNPDRINSELIAESVQAVLGSEQKPVWHKVMAKDSLTLKVQKQFKAKKMVPDTLYVGTIENDKVLQYIIADIAPSRSEKFSYLLYFDVQKKITDVDVLEYRENYGYEIDYSYFRNQFKGKSKAGDIRFRRSIQNISGATISARSLTNSVHDLLLIINQISLP